MAVFAFPFPFTVALVMVTAFVVVAATRPAGVSAPRPGSRLDAVRRQTSRWRWVGVGLGAGFAIVAVQTDHLGRGVMLAAPLFALGVLAGVLAGELRVLAPTSQTRSATLEVRRVRDYLPRGLTAVVAAATVALAALLAVTTAVGSPDDLGRAGRFLTVVCSAVSSESRGPWPGSFYSVPLAATVSVGLLLAGLALREIVRRPRQGEDEVVDDAERRSAGAAVVAASGILVAVPLAGVAMFAAIGLLGVSCPPAWMPVLGWTAVALLPLAGAVCVWCAAVVLAPPRARVGVRA